MKEPVFKSKFKIGIYEKGHIFDSFGGIVSGVVDSNNEVRKFTDKKYFRAFYPKNVNK